MTAALSLQPLASTPASARLRVCVSLPFARQLVLGGNEPFGGAELRGLTFASGLAADPTLEVHVVVNGSETTPVVRSDRITVHFRRNVSFYEGHMDHPRHSIWGAVDADVYVGFGANEATAELARFCLAHGSAFVLSIASDAAFDPLVGEQSVIRDAYGVAGHYHWYAMHHAHAVFVQTERQRDLFRSMHGREAVLIRNPAPSAVRSAPRRAPQFGGRILWIGRTDPNKRHDAALRLAEALPHRRMIMVCNGIDRSSITDIETARPNLSLAEKVALPDVDGLFRFSDVLVNTSVVEGSPNAFLQAGMHGIPIVSMAVDPDGMLATHGCGRVADGTLAGLARAVESLLTEPGAYASAASASVRWVADRHDPAGRIAELRALVHHTATTHGRRRALRSPLT